MKDLSNIKLIILDNDGVLTDGKISYDNHRVETKSFSAKDGLGITLLKFTDISLAIITGRTSDILLQRCEDLNIKHYYQLVHNKFKKAESLLKKLDLSWENVAYMGDDWNDYPVLKHAYFTAAPADAFDDFKSKVDYVASRNGGDGAVREFIDYILKQQGIYEKVLDDYVTYLESK